MKKKGNEVFDRPTVSIMGQQNKHKTAHQTPQSVHLESELVMEPKEGETGIQSRSE